LIFLAVGDIVGENGLDFLVRHLPSLKKLKKVDFVIANGENASGRGITPKQADEMLSCGVDVITLGNHAFSRREIAPYLDECGYILRPANMAPQSPGRGFGMFECGGKSVLVINLIGQCMMDFGPENAFLCADRILKENRADITFVDFHAQATSEKLAMGYYLDGRVSGVFGTHTHVKTDDARVNPRGTGYITDLGMSGPEYSVLGVKPEQSIAFFRGDLAPRFETAGGACALSGVIFDIDENTGLCLSCESINIR